jgi:acyl-CoA thioester hydrolase
MFSHEIEIRVRYQETDAQGHVHHANYITWFELGRTEMLRSVDRDYDALERSGVMLVVAEMNVKYYRPSHFGDVVTLRTEVVEARGARIKHRYQVTLKGELLAEGESVVASVDANGRARRLPDWLRTDKSSSAPPAE